MSRRDRIESARSLRVPFLSIEDFELRHLGRLDVLDADLGGELLDEPEEVGTRRGARSKRLLEPAVVAALAEEDVERDLAEERHAHRLGLPAGSSSAEEVDLLVAGRFEKLVLRGDVASLGAASGLEIGLHVEEAHVLDHAQDRDLELSEHRDGPDGVDERDLLRRADHDGPGEREALRER